MKTLEELREEFMGRFAMDTFPSGKIWKTFFDIDVVWQFIEEVIKEEREEFNNKFVEFRGDDSAYGAGLYIKQNSETIDELEEWIEQLLAKKMEEKEEEFREDLKYLKRSYQESNIDENFIESALNELTVKYKLN